MNEPVPDDRPAAASIHCRAVTVRFAPQAVAVDRVDLDVSSGEIVALIGPSGCGKTTLLRAIAGLQPVTGGQVELDPAAIADEGQIGFVFQQPGLLPWATTLQNVLLPLELIGRGSRPQRRLAAEASLASVQLADATDKRPHELSGGMQMRASIARALVTHPSVLLLDEPFAALDDMLRNDLGRLLLSLWQRQRFTAVMVTHNISESILLSHRIAVMREGVLETVIDNPLAWPRDPTQMRTPQFAEFFGVVSDLLRGPADSPQPETRGGAS
ncbi:ABC transporter ATP-binding protein [Rhodopirellula sp. JC639]|uniref:ABC transporter ATP-binding protein n=1 Tax=Stieleria mannarensis TaxID=2755585 RepID=UPI001603CEE3